MKRTHVVPHPLRSERGQSLVELAISLTVMLLLLSGAVTFGMALFSYVALRDAAQEGALYGSFNPYADTNGDGKYENGEPINDAQIRARVRSASTSPLNLSSTAVIPEPYITIEATSPTGQACEGTYTVSGSTVANGVRVSVQYDYPIIMPYIGGIIGSQKIHLRATVTDTILEPKCP
jgi:Flp pilus assembly protein TadG